MGFFEQIFGTELGLPARAVVALVLVLALIALTVWLMRRFGEGRISGGGNARGRQQRLAVLDSTTVDARRRLVLIRRDNVEHLILIGGPTDVVIEPNIVRAQSASGAPRPGARPGGYDQDEDASIAPYDLHETERVPSPSVPSRTPAAGEAPRTMPRPPQRVDPQYADMAQRLEAALRSPAPEEARRPAPQPAPTPAPQPAPAPRAPEPRAPEPRIAAPEPRPATPPAPTPRAPMPRIPEPRIEPRVAEAPAPRAPEPRVIPQPAPQPAPAQQATAADVFGSLEEEMASLLRPGKKDAK